MCLECGSSEILVNGECRRDNHQSIEELCPKKKGFVYFEKIKQCYSCSQLLNHGYYIEKLYDSELCKKQTVVNLQFKVISNPSLFQLSFDTKRQKLFNLFEKNITNIIQVQITDLEPNVNYIPEIILKPSLDILVYINYTYRVVIKSEK
jgi:hypothetical protein